MGQSRLSRTLAVMLIAFAFVAIARAASNAAKKTQYSSAPVYGYEEIEQEVAFLHEAKQSNCRCIGCADVCTSEGDCANAPTCCQTSFFQSSFSCPDNKDQHYNQGPHEGFNPDAPIVPPEVLEVGSCDWTRNFFDTEIQVGNSKSDFKYGTFSVTCYIVDGGEKCGHPFCDQMVISAQGGMFRVAAVSESHEPTVPSLDESCVQDPALKAPFNPIVKKSNKTHTATRTHKPLDSEPIKGKRNGRIQYWDEQVGPDGPYYDGPGYDGPGYDGPDHIYASTDPTALYQGTAWLYQGPATISSRHYDIKHHTGWFEYVYDWLPSNASALPVEAANDLYLAKPYTVKLLFYKSRGY